MLQVVNLYIKENFADIKLLVYLTILLPVMYLSSCTTEEWEVAKQATIRISIEVKESGQQTTRITGTYFEQGDAIGIYVVDLPGVIGLNNNAYNVRHTFDGFNWQTRLGEELYWKNETTGADIFAYYPFDSEMGRIAGKLNLSSYPFKVSEDQRLSYTSSDFLWAKAGSLYPTEEAINMLFTHSLSKIVVNIMNDTDISENVFSDLQIYNLKNNCLIDMNSGLATVSGEVAIIKPYETQKSDQQSSYCAIVIPQMIVAGTPLFTLDVNGTRLIYEIGQDIEFLPQKEYQFNLTITTSTRNVGVYSGEVIVRDL